MALAPRVLVEFTRASHVESVHHGWLSLSSEPAPAEPYPTVFVRSAMKPFQALPLLMTGTADAFAMSDAELALACSSHNGQPFQTETVAGLLARADIPAEALQCGAHPPMRQEDADTLQAQGHSPTALHNNCSGKHAGFLLVCRHQGWPLADYLNPDHPLQRQIRATIAGLAGLPPEALIVGIDGCSAPTFAMPLDRLCRLFQALAKPGHQPLAPHLGRICRAIAANPRYLAGDGRFDTDLMTAGPFVVKAGAEAVHAGVHLPTGTSWALKIADGGRRAVSIAVIGALHAAGLLDADHPDLAAHRGGELRNHAGLLVGEGHYRAP